MTFFRNDPEVGKIVSLLKEWLESHGLGAFAVDIAIGLRRRAEFAHYNNIPFDHVAEKRAWLLSQACMLADKIFSNNPANRDLLRQSYIDGIKNIGVDLMSTHCGAWDENIKNRVLNHIQNKVGQDLTNRRFTAFEERQQLLWVGEQIYKAAASLVDPQGQTKDARADNLRPEQECLVKLETALSAARSNLPVPSR